MERKPVSFWRLVQRLGLYWLAFPILFALVFGGVGLVMTRDALLLAREGVVTQALVLDKQIETRRSSDGKTSTSYHIRYIFHPNERAEPITRRQSVSRSLYRQAETGTEIPVTYAWSNPDRASIDPSHDRLGAYIFGGFGALATLISLGLGGWMFGRKLSILRALRRGDVREARVTAIRETNVRKNKERQYVIDWVDATGETGTSMMDGFKTLSKHPEGSVIVVYIDPKTGRGWWDAQL